MNYRVWCKNKKEYERDQCFLTPDGRLFQEGAHGNMQPLSLDNHIIEIATGLEDKKGVSGYIGDVVEFDSMDCVIKWNREKGCFNLVPISTYSTARIYNLRYGTIIGNIHGEEQIKWKV